MKKTLSEDVLILRAIRFARFCVKTLPLGLCFAVARWVAWLVYKTSKRSRIAYKNLRMVFAGKKSSAELKRLGLASFQNLAMSGVEMLRIPDMTPQDIETRFTIEGREHFEPYIREGKGVIFLSGHFGNWELLNIFGAMSGYPIVALARVQKHPRSDAYLNSLRVSKGSQIIYKGIPVREILRALKNGKIVGILSDQDGGRGGCFVNFFNRLSSTPPGVAAFALRADCPIFPTFIVREKKTFHRIIVEKPIFPPKDVASAGEAETVMIQEFAAALERQVRLRPEQWLWMHRRWKSSPDRVVVILSDGKTGHVQQSMAVLDAMRRQRQEQGIDPKRLVSRMIEVTYRSSFRKKCWKASGFIFRGRPPFAESMLEWALAPKSSAAVRSRYADVVISCGSSLVELNLWMKKENGAKSVVVMKPHRPLEAFDAVIAPKHDGLKSAENIFVTEGALSRLQPEDRDREARKLRDELLLSGEAKSVGVLIGGNTGELKFEPVLFEKIMRSLCRFSEENKLQVFVTTSRRTPAWAESILKQLYKNNPLCSLLVIANEANREGVVAGILGLSDAVIVTGESMSMVSEAVGAGKPVLVFHPCRAEALKKKYLDTLTGWENEGKVVICDTQNLAQKLKAALESPLGAPGIDETERALTAAVRRVF